MKVLALTVGVAIIVVLIVLALLPGTCHSRDRRRSPGDEESDSGSIETTASSNTLDSQPTPGIRFFLYTQQNPDTAQELATGSESLIETSNYVKGAVLKIVIHGFGSSALKGNMQKIKDAYVEGNRTLNVVLVDWEHLARKPWYEQAAGRTHLVGQSVGEFITFLVDKRHVTFEDVHILGHSLGAHVAGFAGRYIGDQNVGRITALDPAKPLFTEVGDSHRIDQSDAAFVDVIHTGARFISLLDPLGHLDFYPNGGESQPGCGVDLKESCRHKRANYYMAESIKNPESFVAWKCDSWDSFERGTCYSNEEAHMGEWVSKSARGTYYLKTNAQVPYSF